MRIVDKSQLEGLGASVRKQLERELHGLDVFHTALRKHFPENFPGQPGDATAPATQPSEAAVKPRKRRRRRSRPEQEAGRLLVQWVDTLTDPLTGLRVGDYFAHNANGGARTANEAAILIGQGVRPGWPDYTLYMPRPPWHGLVLELKATNGSKPSEEQLAILLRLERIGYKTVIAWGFDEARAAIEDYLTHPHLRS